MERRHLLVKDFMTREIITVDETTSVVDAAKLMAAEDIGSLFITRGDAIIGIVTQRDVISAHLLSDSLYHSLTVSDVMSTPIVSIGPDVDIWDAICLMNQTGKRHIAVVDGDMTLGIVTATDVIRVLATMRLIAEGAKD